MPYRVLVAALLVALCACTFRMGDLSIVSSQNVELDPQVVQRGVEARDCVNLLLFIPLGSLVPNVEEAMDRALAQAPEANVLMDVATYSDQLFTYFFNRTCVRVKGDAGKLAP